MAVTLINPDGHVRVPIHHHVAVATGSRQVHLAGQVAWDENGDLAGQVAQVCRNVARALDAAGATFHDVVRFTWHAAGRKREMYDAFNAGIEQAAREFDLATPLALIGVDILVEAEATALIDRAGPGCLATLSPQTPERQ